MKKIFALLMFAAIGLTASAVGNEPSVYSVQTNSFWANWFASADYRFNLTVGDQEPGFKPFKNVGDRASHGFSLALGKWFTPGLGLRLKYSGLQGKMMSPAGTKLDDLRSGLFEGDLLFNFTNLFCGYRADRCYHFIPYVGAGWIRNYGSSTLDGKTYNAGILNTWRLNDKWAVNCDVNAAWAPNRYDGYAQSTDFRNQDVILNVEVGVTFSLGRQGWNRSIDERAIRDEYDVIISGMNDQLTGLNSRLADAEAENVRLREALAQKPNEVVTATSAVHMVNTNVPYSVFFGRGSARLEEKQAVNLEAVAAVAKENPQMRVYITGYADKATGSVKSNEELSVKRADVLARELQALGVEASQIVAEGKGGMDILSTASHNRRAVIEIK